MKTTSWDWLVRLVHWSVAGLFLYNYFWSSHGSIVHMNIGWTLMGLVITRLLWGLFAKPPARLTSFFPTPQRIKTHVYELKQREQPANVGHNPFGAIAIFLMWFGLIFAAFTGWFMDTDWGFEHDVYEWHELTVELLFYLICVHVSAVVIMSFWLKRNLIRAMIVGSFKNSP